MAIAMPDYGQLFPNPITEGLPTILPRLLRTPFERSRPAADATREVNGAVVA